MISINLLPTTPYRTRDNRNDGAVITFIDISGPKVLESTLLETLSILKKRFATQYAESNPVEELTEVFPMALADKQALRRKPDEVG